ncbi:hypothetical protein MML48_9g00000303 [Holotrichia oblita]|uniref:Uncharacterized protein n=1 Tax=Holotrichia oblita TaxID=644536 RepID=A0ACB9SP32_HOLOL|nr:hypothetical protein MML48_9g00000303 [Holotrichia oblita]
MEKKNKKVTETVEQVKRKLVDGSDEENETPVLKIIKSHILIRGKDPHATATNALRRLLTNELATKYSLHGKQKKRVFKDLLSYRLIFDIVQLHTKAATEAEVNNFIATWLMQAPLRYSREQKEKKQYELSLKSGASADDVYCIKLWYYDLFNFINDQCTRRESSSNLDSDDENSYEGDNTQESSTADQQKSTGNNEVQSTLPNNNSSRPPKPGKAKRNDETIANELMESVRDHFKRPRPNITEDRCDIIGNNVAIKLRALDAKTISVAEKLNDLIFEAELGHLTPEHAYINMRDILGQNQRSYVPAQLYGQQVYYQSSPSNGTYTPVSFISSGSPSPPCLSFPFSQHSEHLAQSFQTSHVLNSPQANPYSTQMKTPTIPRNQPNEAEIVLSIPDSAATFLNNFDVDDNV